MKKRLCSILAALVLALAVMAALTLGASAAEIVASGECGKEGDNLTWTLDADGVLTISGTGEMADYGLPSADPVTQNGAIEPWRTYSSMIQQVKLGNGVTSVGTWAFRGYSSLTAVTISESVTAVRELAFAGCDNLTSVTIPGSVTSVGAEVFSDCIGLKSAGPIGGGYNIEFGWTKSIPANAFHYCSSLTSVTIPEGVTSIGANVFQGCGLKSVTIPRSVTSIGESAFRSCTDLTSVTIPAGVSDIGPGAFGNCLALREILVDIANSKFQSVDGVLFSRDGTVLVRYPEKKPGTSYDIPEGVTSIGESAFESCSLRSVTIPDSVTSVGRSAFESCSLISVTIPRSVTRIGESAFALCDLATVTISEGVTSIGAKAFYDCCNLTGVTIPGSATSIGEHAFGYCTRLRSAGPASGGYNIEFGWTESVPEKAFYGCSSLISVTIPEGVTSIGAHAFEDCSGLTSVTIPESVTSIGAGAFEDCSGLTSVTIPESVTSIGAGAFERCSLRSVTIPESVTSIGAGAFSCAGLKSAGPAGGGYDIEFGWTESVPAYAFSGYSGLTSVMIPGSAATIGEYAFSGSCALETVTFSEGVTRIGEKAFENCVGLKSVTIPKSVTDIGHSAFYCCDSLTDVYYGGSEKQWEYEVGAYHLSETVTIHYAADDITVTAAAGEHGTVDPSGTLPVYKGESMSFTILPDEGYKATLTVDGVTVVRNGVLVEGTLPDVTEGDWYCPDTDSVSYYTYPGEHGAGRAVRLYLVDIRSDRTVSVSFAPEEGPEPADPEVPPPEETEKKLEDLAKDLTATGEEIRRTLEDLAQKGLAEAVKELGGQVFDKIEALEKRLGEGGSATVEVEAGACFLRTDVSVTGAKLNFDYSKTVSLKIGKPEDPDIRVPEAPAGQALTRFSMKLVEGESNNAAELTVPIRVTLPVPARSLKEQTLKIWHYHGGSLVPLTLISRPFQKDGQWYVSFMVSGFSDFIMTYETEAEPVTAALSPDGKRVEFTDPAGMLAGGARVLAARYGGGRLAESVSSGIAAGESAADFTKALSADWRLFLLNPKTGAPLCGVDWKK